MKHALFGLILSLIFIPSLAMARVDLLPHLLVIEGRQRSADLTVLNLGNEVNRFEVKFINYRQNENGTYTILEQPLHEDFDPQKIVRMSPQEFVLDPKGKQKIRIAVRKPADLPEGEYRFHVIATGYAFDREVPQDFSERVGVGLTVNVGIAIPVIVRHGELERATSKLKDFKLLSPSQSDSGRPELQFRATRDGDTSVLGEVQVAWSPAGTDEFTDIGFITNFNIFPEISYRDGAVPLDALPLGAGRLRILYKDTHSDEIYDEVVIDQ